MTFKIRREQESRQTPSENRPQPPHGNWERDTIHHILRMQQQEQRSARFWKNLWRGVGVLMFFAVLGSIHSCSTATGGNASFAAQGEHTAVINLTGEIGGGYQDQVQMLREGLQAAYDNGNAKGIIIRADSPGGSPVVSNIAFNEIRRLKAEHPDTPVYVVAENMCASGCYYIAAAADKIYADPSSMVGSIGVIGGGFDFTGLMEKLGIKRRLKTAGSNKGMGDPFTPETPEQQAIWQKMLNEIHTEFINAVKQGRGSRLQEKTYPDLFSGRVFTGREAKNAGLIDDFGNVYSVARDVVKAPELVDYTPQDDDIARAISRRLNSEVQNQIREGLNGLDSKAW
ncbi:MAG: S49 family peptidase [Neisseria sp.]|nr:S49 family peptidase [Neisseria sp.]